MWFKNYVQDIPDTKVPLEESRIQDMILEYINRNHFLIKELEKQIRPGRNKPPKIELLTGLKNQEMQEVFVSAQII